jgi:hypothetical protein
LWPIWGPGARLLVERVEYCESSPMAQGYIEFDGEIENFRHRNANSDRVTPNRVLSARIS